MNEPCHFLRKNGKCGALTVCECREPETCSFRKTETQYIKDLDRSINICRAKNLCESCEYMHGEPCKLSTEKYIER